MKEIWPPYSQQCLSRRTPQPLPAANVGSPRDPEYQFPPQPHSLFRKFSELPPPSLSPLLNPGPPQLHALRAALPVAPSLGQLRFPRPPPALRAGSILSPQTAAESSPLPIANTRSETPPKVAAPHN